ncbi:MAG: hypothetical protein H7Y16_03975 [Candidatus Parcubacteria bacterium]|nr:hypothetical protein [Burkholderiales bacterium]
MKNAKWLGWLFAIFCLPAFAAETVYPPPSGAGPIVYPDGQHGFNLNGPTYRRDYESDAWRRTQDMLRAIQPLKP